MSEPTITDFSSNLLGLFRETFEGTGGQGSHYIDGRGHGSLLETLETISSEQASRPLKPSGATIAAHTAHTRYYLQTLKRFMHGEENFQMDWPGSWQPRQVERSQWENLKKSLVDEYEATMTALEAVPDWNDDAVSAALSMLAHSAYHLGAIRVFAVALPK